MPVQVFAHYRIWYDELRRELRLLALNHGDDYPVAQELSEITLQVEQERRQARGVDRLDAAIAAGQDRADLDYHVPARRRRHHGPAARAARGGRRVLPRAAAAHPGRPTAQQVPLREWYLGEFSRQAAGEEPPTPWPGVLRRRRRPA